MGKQPTTGQKKTKEAIARAAANSRKGSKKKWTTGKVKEKLNHAVLLEPKQFKEIEKALPQMRLITLSTVCEKFKVVASIARQLIRYFAAQKKIDLVDYHQQCPIYAGKAPVKAEGQDEKAGKDGEKKGKGKAEKAEKAEKA